MARESDRVERFFASAQGARISRRVISLAYHNEHTRHNPYEHAFGAGVEMWTLNNGGILLRHPTQHLWGEYIVKDTE